MKLMFCRKCQDIFRLFSEELTCFCGHASGKLDGQIAVITNGVPLTFNALSFFTAIKTRRSRGDGSPFNAFVIPETCRSVKYTKEDLL